MDVHQLLNQSIRGLSDRAANGIDTLVVPRECRQPQSPELLSVRLFHDSTLDYCWFCLVASCLHGLGYLVDCPIEVDRRISSNPWI